MLLLWELDANDAVNLLTCNSFFRAIRRTFCAIEIVPSIIGGFGSSALPGQPAGGAGAFPGFRRMGHLDAATLADRSTRSGLGG